MESSGIVRSSATPLERLQELAPLANNAYQPNEEYTALYELLDALHQAGRVLRFDRVLTLPRTKEGTPTSDLDRLLAVGPMSPAKRQALTRAVRLLSRHSGGAFQVAHIGLAEQLAHGSPAAKQLLTELLKRAAPLRDPRDGERLAAIPWVPSLFGDEPKKMLALIDSASARLQRKLTVNEMTALLWAAKRSPEIETLFGPGTAKLPAELALGDLYTWQQLDAKSRAPNKKELVQELRGHQRPVALRNDENAQYHEISLGQIGTDWPLGKLHKLRLLSAALEQPTFLASLRRVIDSDIGDASAEAGGLVRLDNGAASLQALPSAITGDGHYLLPPDQQELQSVVRFHVHAARGRGDPTLAGPSTDSEGRHADLGRAYQDAQDGLVFTVVGVDQATGRIRVNVDFYTDSRVVDLGTVDLPPVGNAN